MTERDDTSFYDAKAEMERLQELTDRESRCPLCKAEGRGQPCKDMSTKQPMEKVHRARADRTAQKW